MDLCVNCGIRLKSSNAHRAQPLSDDEQILSVISQWRAPYPVTSSDYICQACWHLAESSSPGDPRQLGHRNICVRCGCSIASRVNHLLHHGSIRESKINYIIQRWIKPRIVEEPSRICHNCWVAADRAATRMVPGSSASSKKTRRRDLLVEVPPMKKIEVQRPEVSVTSGSGNTSPQRDAAVAQAAETTDDEETRDESPGPEQSETSGNGDTSPQRDATVAHAVETTVEDQIKAFIARVFHYLEQEFETIKNMDAATVLRHLARLPHRTARATGVSEATVLAIIEEEARRNAAERARREGEAHASAAGSGKTRKRRRVRKKQSLAESGSEVSDGSVDEARPSQASVPQDTTIAPAAELLVMKTEPFEYYNEEPAIDIVPANETAINKEQVQKDPISIDVKVEAPVASDDEMTDTNETSPTKPATSKRRRISRQSDRSDHTYTHDQERIDSDPLSSNVKVEAPDEEMNESHMLRVRLKAERENDEEGFS